MAHFVQTNPPGAAAPSKDGSDRLITHIVTLALSPRPVKDTPNFGEMLDSLTTGAVMCIHFHFPFDWSSWLLRLSYIPEWTNCERCRPALTEPVLVDHRPVSTPTGGAEVSGF